MRLILLTALVMVAFASNSLLNRVALVDGAISAGAYAAWRTGSGAVALAVLVALRGAVPRPDGRQMAVGTLALLVYMFGFSLAYLGLDAGVGALILFGMTQVTMFAGGLCAGERPPLRRWLGAGLALGGLGWLLLPGASAAVQAGYAALMAVAGIGWGLYSLNGRQATDPLAATAWNFIAAAPVCVAVALLWTGGTATTLWGIALAVFAGVVTSGLGYALWYAVLPRLEAAVAALAQLTVPVIAMLAGLVLLGEAVTWGGIAAAALVLSGVALGAWPKRPK